MANHQHDAPIAIVGAGLAGLCCALHLQQAGADCVLLEAEDRAGGRVRTDLVDGYRLDRGFQVLLTSYPEPQRVLDYDALDLRAFEPGAVVRARGGLHRLADPERRLLTALKSLSAPVGSLSDKLKVRGLRQRATQSRVAAILSRPEATTSEALAELGFSTEMIELFWRPFFAGVFLEHELTTSSRWFELLFRLFALGDAALPAMGMGEIPRQLASRLAPGTLRTHARVKAAEAHEVRLEDGETIRARAVVLATAEPQTRRLLGEPPNAAWNGVTCVYFGADAAQKGDSIWSNPAWRDPVLGLDGTSKGPINNLCIPSRTCPEYAPEGKELVSVTVLGTSEEDETLVDGIHTQLSDWFGRRARDWELLRIYRIEHALPAQPPGSFLSPSLPVAHASGIFLCGDFLETPSIHGAMVAGRKTAEALLDRQHS